MVASVKKRFGYGEGAAKVNILAELMAREVNPNSNPALGDTNEGR